MQINVTIFSTKFESWCKFFSPINLVSLRKLAPSRNAVFNHQKTGMDFVTEISFCKTPVVDEKRLIFRGWELESQLGKSFKVSGQTFIRRRTRSHNLWLLLVNMHVTYIKYSQTVPWSYVYTSWKVSWFPLLGSRVFLYSRSVCESIIYSGLIYIK